ncbi:hypothetical protein B0H67DRAFT_252350 [Lasiosphaeris hirsuta]|uniref:Uncharacterized protein n=1 Tax=Lasiosphaeris hirsuta TaxID=260670 RepID=A0AA40DWP0_9PEZI|nr:hypothetical protein B0H67DRAFT_252350 [Lasiosphaeris hirsuta]
MERNGRPQGTEDNLTTWTPHSPRETLSEIQAYPNWPSGSQPWGPGSFAPRCFVGASLSGIGCFVSIESEFQEEILRDGNGRTGRGAAELSGREFFLRGPSHSSSRQNCQARVLGYEGTCVPFCACSAHSITSLGRCHGLVGSDCRLLIAQTSTTERNRPPLQSVVEQCGQPPRHGYLVSGRAHPNFQLAIPGPSSPSDAAACNAISICCPYRLHPRLKSAQRSTAYITWPTKTDLGFGFGSRFVIR